MIAKLELWLMRTWHRIAGHPWPWYMLNQGTFCAKCGEQIRSF